MREVEWDILMRLKSWLGGVNIKIGSVRKDLEIENLDKKVGELGKLERMGDEDEGMKMMVNREKKLN